MKPPLKSKESKFAPTTKQWRYLEELQAQADRGVLLTNKETAKRLHIRAETISIWNRDDGFRRAASQIIRQSCDPLFELAMRAATRRAIAGSPKHLELLMRARGLYDPYPAEQPLESPDAVVGETERGPVLAKYGNVTFIGLPVPPTPAEAEARRPPVGSNVIIPAPPSDGMNNGS